jgi:hypothetical protein
VAIGKKNLCGYQCLSLALFSFNVVIRRKDAAYLNLLCALRTHKLQIETCARIIYLVDAKKMRSSQDAINSYERGLKNDFFRYAMRVFFPAHSLHSISCGGGFIFCCGGNGYCPPSIPSFPLFLFGASISPFWVVRCSIECFLQP